MESKSFFRVSFLSFTSKISGIARNRLNIFILDIVWQKMVLHLLAIFPVPLGTKDGSTRGHDRTPTQTMQYE